MEDSYHLHVYKVVEKYEINLEAGSSVEAKNKALELVKNNKIESIESDCNYIVFDYQK